MKTHVNLHEDFCKFTRRLMQIYMNTFVNLHEDLRKFT